MPKLWPAGTRDEFIDLVCAGWSLQAAAMAVGASSPSGSRWWRESGRMDLQHTHGRRGGLVAGVPAADPADGGSRCRRPLTGADRQSIQTGLRLGCRPAQIAAAIGRHRSVVCREIARNTGDDGVYRGALAERVAARRRARPKALKLAADRRLAGWVTDQLEQGWSPRLISQVLASDDAAGRPQGQTWQVSHETIYQALYVQTRGDLRADLHRCLSLKRANRVPRRRDRRANSPFKSALKISDRPAEVDDRAVPGFWEGDLIVGPGSGSAIGTLVERTTRFTILLHLPERHDAETVAAAMIREMRHLPAHLRRSITWDRGVELAAYEKIQVALDTQLFFCDPHSPWQRGTNENTNRLLRFWFAKGTDLSTHTADDLTRVADTLNRRPRPTLDLQTPAQAMNKLLAQTA